MVVKVINRSKHSLPEYATLSSAGLDLRAHLGKDIVLKPMERTLVPTGLYIELPAGYEAQIRPRSGLALKSGISIVNSPGTIDSDYRGEIGVILINLSDQDFIIHDGDRICQMVINEYKQIQWKQVEELNESDRGDGGFGHTGKS